MQRESRLYVCLLAAFIFFSLMVPFSVSAAETIIYAEGFENGNGGYATDGNAQWEWGNPAKPAGPATANSGDKCWGTFPATTVGTLEGNLYTPDISIPSLDTDQLALISFFAYIDIYYEGIRTEGDIYISADEMQTWQLLARFYDEMAGGWQRYQFNVSEYAGKKVNLRFRAYKTDTVPGLFIDDVALAIDAVPSPATLLTLEANEDTAAGASCPWVYPWDGTGFVRDNDIYSVARYPQGEMRDYYLLQKPLVAQGNQYTVEIQEVEAEDSWTDLLGLLAVDHDPEVAIAPDDKGNVLAYRPAELIKPIAAVSSTGSEVLSLVNTEDNGGFKAYSDNYIDLDFGSADLSAGSRILLRVKGFIEGEGAVKPFTGPPAILVQVRDDKGEFQEIGRLNPRFEWSEGMLDLSPYLPDPSGQGRIRLTSISHDVKYHEIDFVALATGPPPAVTVTELPILTANLGEADVLSSLITSDNSYVPLTSGNKFTVAFAATPAQPGLIRDFILMSEGYYVPKSSTFFIYTWDGSQWLQRDSHSFTATDSVKNFNLSPYLPDPDGEYKVRIWQDYSNYAAEIDHTGLQIGSLAGTLSMATDLRNNSSIIDLVRNSDDTRFTYVRDTVTSQPRNRWSEYNWTIPPDSFTIVFTVDSNGLLTGSTNQSVNYGSDSTAVTAVPASGYHFVNWTASGEFTSTDNPLIIFDVTADQTFTANFAPNPVNGSCGSSNTGTFTVEPSTNLCSAGTTSEVTGGGHPWSWSCAGANGGTAANCSASIQTYSVTFASGENGTLTGSTNQTIDYNGSTTAVTALPASSYHFVNWTGTITSPSNPISIANVTEAINLTANFAPNPVNGSCGSSDTGTFTVMPSTNLCSAGTASVVTGGGHPWSWSCAGAIGGTVANCSATIQKWSVTPSAGNNGALSPATPQSVDHGATTLFTITPASGYQIASVSGCGGVVAGTVYTTGTITGDCTVSAVFSPIIPHDGIVTFAGTVPSISDALAVLQHVVGQAPLTANQQIHADVAPLALDGKPLGNGQVDFADVIIILRRVIDAVYW